jgi:hypothetical protein
MTEEATEGRNAFLEKRKPNFEKNGCHKSLKLRVGCDDQL